MKQSQKTLLFWVLVILMCIVIFNFVAREEQPRSVPFSEFVTDVSEGKVKKVKIRPQENSGEYTYWLKSVDESAETNVRGNRNEKVTGTDPAVFEKARAAWARKKRRILEKKGGLYGSTISTYLRFVLRE